MLHGSLEEHLQSSNAAWPLNTDLKPVHLSLYKPWKRDCHEDDRFMINCNPVYSRAGLCLFFYNRDIEP